MGEALALHNESIGALEAATRVARSINRLHFARWLRVQREGAERRISMESTMKELTKSTCYVHISNASSRHCTMNHSS